MSEDISRQGSNSDTSHIATEHEIHIEDSTDKSLDIYLGGDSQEILDEILALKNRYILKFEDVNYVSKKKHLLKGVFGFAAPGEITAIMGPSGAGKSTLLKVLSSRIIRKTTGLITVNNIDIKDVPVKRLFAHVMQEDIFLPHLTVEQQIYYYALLKLPQKLSKKMKKKRVDQIVSQLGLEKCVQVPIERASGGEKKRTNIASEIIHNPAVIMLDEPTSGLDSTSAFLLIKSLRELANKGHTILMTIHQPSQTIFQMIDRLLLLADGETVYFGDASGIYDHFDRCGFSIPPEENPMDFVMDLISGEEPQNEQLSKFSRRMSAIATVEYGGTLAKYQQFQSPKLMTSTWEGELSSEDKITYEWPTSCWYQIGVLFRRSFVQNRGEDFSWLYLFQTVAISLLCGLLWLRMPFLTSYLIDRVGCVFFIVIYWGFQRVFAAFLVFPLEREVIKKERASGIYYLIAYFLAKNLSEMTVSLTFPVLSCTIVYWMTNINPSFLIFLGFVGIVVLVSLTGEALGLAIGAAFLNVRLAMKIATLISLSMMLVTGFYLHTYPKYIEWYKYLSIFRSGFSSAAVLAFSRYPWYYCNSDRYVLCTLGTYIPGTAIASAINIERNLPLDILILVILFIGFRILGFLSLKLLYRP